MKLNSLHCLKIEQGPISTLFNSSFSNVYRSKIELLAYCLSLGKSTCNYNNVGSLEEMQLKTNQKGITRLKMAKLAKKHCRTQLQN